MGASSELSAVLECIEYFENPDAEKLLEAA
jgi:hypothetical protein